MTNEAFESRIILPDAPEDQAEILATGGVACWAEPLTIDTYEPGEPDAYPQFLDRRVYQGSSGRIYPLPIIDSVSHEKAPRVWQAIHLENAYVRLVLLPELGGRIHIGYDKVAGYDFLYRNNVIKPALVGVTGPWISGGIEFNWPQHHRPATFLPTQAHIEREADGSAIVWHSDLDPLQRMRGTHGVRLRPGSSALEVEAVLHNRTDMPQTFLWWANVAARSHERYQSFFPDDVAYVADHARRAITAFPHADRPYYGVDYPALAAEREGADRIDFYGNIPVPSSYMITDTDDAFFGGYDHEADAGFVHWADRSISPGKKQWTWGDGPIGRAWDDQLTDGDGPYVELMAGVYTDNQPDFAWLLPGETKRFRQMWFPIHQTGPVRQATPDAAVGMRLEGRVAHISAITTARRTDAIVELRRGTETVATWRADVAPEQPFAAAVEVGSEAGLSLTVSHDGEELVSWRARTGRAPEPWVAAAPGEPEQIESSDELLVTATHLTQNRHPNRSAVPYLREALKRDSGDSRALTALGAWHLRRGEYGAAREALERAVSRLTRRNLNPRDGEAHYVLALACERLGDFGAADLAFGKAAWNAAWASPSHLGRARLALRAGNRRAAAEHADRADGPPEAERIAAIARGDLAERLPVLLRADPLDPVLRALDGREPLDARAGLDVACELARAGAFELALATTTTDTQRVPAAGLGGPIRHYLRAAWRDALGAADAAAAEREAARRAPRTLAFPAGLDQFDALMAARSAEPSDTVAAGLVGMWLLDAGRDVEALYALRIAAAGDDPVDWRNLAIALEKADDAGAADDALAHALELRRDARLVFERDVLAEGRGVSPEERLTRMLVHEQLLLRRDDLAVRYVELMLRAGRNDEALATLRGRRFRPFEGGEGRVIAAFDRAECAVVAELIGTDPARAARALEQGFVPPANLGEGRHPAERPVERYVLLGRARAAAGDAEGARSAWREAVAPTPLAVAPRAVDEHTYWEGIARLELGDAEGAAAAWRALDERAAALREAGDRVDHFETSHPELSAFSSDTAASRGVRADELEQWAERGRGAAAAWEGVLR